MSDQQLIDALRGMQVFQGFEDRDLRAIANRVEIRELSEPVELISEGTEGDEFFLLIKGEAEVRKDGAPLARLGPGSHFGELALLDPAPRAASVSTLGPATVGVLNQLRFKMLLDAVPPFAPRMLAALARGLRGRTEPDDSLAW